MQEVGSSSLPVSTSLVLLGFPVARFVPDRLLPGLAGVS